MLGFDIAWHNATGKIGAVALGDCAIFFREVEGHITPATFWVFCEDLDDAHTGLLQRGADIVEGPENKPWGLSQFTVYDHCKNRYYFFRDL